MAIAGELESQSRSLLNLFESVLEGLIDSPGKFS